MVLPKIVGVPTPKGKKVWEPYKKLKIARDSIIHFKSSDQYAADKDSLYFQFLNGGFEGYPSAAIGMIKYFIKGKKPRWLSILSNEVT